MDGPTTRGWGTPRGAPEGASMTEAAHVTATRRSYDTVAVDYERLLTDQLAEVPLDRAMLAEFVRAVGTGEGPRAVGDLGCGTGRVTSHLRDIGADAFGVDLSPGMIAVARGTYPGLRFEVGSMTALGLPDASPGGVLSWYSTVHMPEAELVASFAEFRRVLAPGGHVLVAPRWGTGAYALSGPTATRSRSTCTAGHRSASPSTWRRPASSSRPVWCVSRTRRRRRRRDSSWRADRAADPARPGSAAVRERRRTGAVRAPRGGRAAPRVARERSRATGRRRAPERSWADEILARWPPPAIRALTEAIGSPPTDRASSAPTTTGPSATASAAPVAVTWWRGRVRRTSEVMVTVQQGADGAVSVQVLRRARAATQT